MRIAFLATRFLDPDNIKSWSGLPFFMKRALERAGVETVALRADDADQTSRWARFLYWRWMRGKRYLRYCDAGLLKNYARQYEADLATIAVDAVFSASTWLTAHLKTKLPTVFWTDACFAGMQDFYAAFSELAPPSIRAGHVIEQRALDRCARAIYCSDWAAGTARRFYRVDSAKISVVPFGANLPEPPNLEEVRAAVSMRSAARCNLLFVGVDWARKGADIAVQTVDSLT
ncbi:MAG: glycosyltransferase, partial [Verrucomicrobiota bacterium]|nr:glycosyltransferase [Verrucomicrobiota bacterium]